MAERREDNIKISVPEIDYEDRGEWNCHVHVHLCALVLVVFNFWILLLKCTLLHYCVHQSVRQ